MSNTTLLPELKLRFDIPKTAQSTEVDSLIRMAELFGYQWFILKRWLTKVFDSGIGTSYDTYFTRHEFEFYRGKPNSVLVSMVSTYSYSHGKDADPVFIEAKIFVRETLVALINANLQSLLGEGPETISVVQPLALEKVAVHLVNVSQYIQISDWWDKGEHLACLIAYHRRNTMILDISLDKVSKIEPLFKSFAEVGIVFKVVEHGPITGYRRFVAIQNYNWNTKWRDVRSDLSKVLGNYREFDVEKSLNII